MTYRDLKDFENDMLGRRFDIRDSAGKNLHHGIESDRGKLFCNKVLSFRYKGQTIFVAVEFDSSKFEKYKVCSAYNQTKDEPFDFYVGNGHLKTSLLRRMTEGNHYDFNSKWIG